MGTDHDEEEDEEEDEDEEDDEDGPCHRRKCAWCRSCATSPSVNYCTPTCWRSSRITRNLSREGYHSLDI